MGNGIAAAISAAITLVFCCAAALLVRRWKRKRNERKIAQAIATLDGILETIPRLLETGRRWTVYANEVARSWQLILKLAGLDPHRAAWIQYCLRLAPLDAKAAKMQDIGLICHYAERLLGIIKGTVISGDESPEIVLAEMEKILSRGLATWDEAQEFIEGVRWPEPRRLYSRAYESKAEQALNRLRSRRSKDPVQDAMAVKSFLEKAGHSLDFLGIDDAQLLALSRQARFGVIIPRPDSPPAA